MGNRRSVEKALEHVGARATVTSDHERLRAAAGLVVPGVGAFPRAMENLRELGLDELLRERVAAGTPVLGICLGMQLAFDSSTELGGADRPGHRARRGARALRVDGALKLPHIGWNEVSFTQPGLAAGRGAAERCAFYHVHSLAPVPADEADILGVGRVRRAVRQRRAARLLLRRAVPPGEVLRRRPAAAGELRAHLRRARRVDAGTSSCRPPRGEALPGDRHPRRQRRAPGQGRLRREEGLRRGPAVGRPRRGSAAGAEYLHVVDLDGAKRGRAGQPRAAAADRQRVRACRCSTAEACASPRRSSGRSTRAPRA